MKPLILWLPRIAGAAVAAFFSMFAFGALRGGHALHASPHFLPALLVLAIVAAGWRRPLVGAVGFALCAVGYGVTARRLDWFAVIGVPLLVVSGLHVLSWRVNSAPGPRV